MIYINEDEIEEYEKAHPGVFDEFRKEFNRLQCLGMTEYLFKNKYLSHKEYTKIKKYMRGHSKIN